MRRWSAWRVAEVEVDMEVVVVEEEILVLANMASRTGEQASQLRTRGMLESHWPIASPRLMCSVMYRR